MCTVVNSPRTGFAEQSQLTLDVGHPKLYGVGWKDITVMMQIKKEKYNSYMFSKSLSEPVL